MKWGVINGMRQNVQPQSDREEYILQQKKTCGQYAVQQVMSTTWAEHTMMMKMMIGVQ